MKMKFKSKYYIFKKHSIFFIRGVQKDHTTVIYTLTFSGIKVLLESLNRAELLKAFPAC